MILRNASHPAKDGKMTTEVEFDSSKLSTKLFTTEYPEKLVKHARKTNSLVILGKFLGY